MLPFVAIGERRGELCMEDQGDSRRSGLEYDDFPRQTEVEERELKSDGSCASALRKPDHRSSP